MQALLAAWMLSGDVVCSLMVSAGPMCRLRHLQPNGFRLIQLSLGLALSWVAPSAETMGLIQRCDEMKKLFPPLLLIALWSSGAVGQTAGPPTLYCNKSFVVSAGATAITQIVAPVAGQSLHLCGYDLNTGAAAGTFQLSIGTGSNCGTGTTSVTPAFSLGVNGVLVSRPGGVWYSSPVGSALCYTITGTGPMNALVSYGQF
jgi:hypothetical protein